MLYRNNCFIFERAAESQPRLHFTGLHAYSHRAATIHELPKAYIFLRAARPRPHRDVHFLMRGDAMFCPRHIRRYFLFTQTPSYRPTAYPPYITSATSIYLINFHAIASMPLMLRLAQSEPTGLRLICFTAADDANERAAHQTRLYTPCHIFMFI